VNRDNAEGRTTGRQSTSGEHGHLDRKIPIALVATLVGYGVATVWWSATIDNRMTVVESWIADNKQIQSRLDRLEIQGEFIQQSLTDIKSLLGQRSDAAP
jgi:hypothetical protein